LIEDSKNNHTLKIDNFPKDLENFIGIKEKVKPHRKPQHVLLRWKEDEVLYTKKKALIDKIEVLIKI
jgi:hypothetical protein